jgi:hypothetical protein
MRNILSLEATPQHQELYDKAVEALSNLFSDPSVSPSVTRKSLEELKGEINIYIDALDLDDAQEGAALTADEDWDVE